MPTTHHNPYTHDLNPSQAQPLFFPPERYLRHTWLPVEDSRNSARSDGLSHGLILLHQMPFDIAGQGMTRTVLSAYGFIGWVFQWYVQGNEAGEKPTSYMLAWLENANSRCTAQAGQRTRDCLLLYILCQLYQGIFVRFIVHIFINCNQGVYLLTCAQLDPVMKCTNRFISAGKHVVV